MKKVFLAVALVCMASIISIAVFSSTVPAENNIPATISNEKQVITVSENDKRAVDSSKVLEARFLNMLNHNFVYNESFDTVEEIVNCSMPALLQYRSTEDDAFIAESYVADYVQNMYGIEIESFEEINKDFDRKAGYVYIIPRGFTKYSHSIVAVKANEDGSYSVTTRVKESSHDSGDIMNTCTTLFVPNEASSFGFNIIYSEIGTRASAL